MPVSFQADGEMIAVAFQRLKLAYPIDYAATHCRPFVAAPVRLLYRVLAMTVANSILRQKIVAVWIGLFIMLGRFPDPS